MLSRLINAAAGGYISLSIQMIATVLILPYILSSHGIGLAGYGRVMAAMAIAGVLGLTTDGIRLAMAKTIGETEPRFRYNGLKRLLVYAALFAVIISSISFFLILFIGAGSIIDGIGLSIWLLLILRFFTEQISWVVQSYLQSENKVTAIAFAKSLETILRSFAIVAVFEWIAANERLYVLLLVIFVLFRTLQLSCSALWHSRRNQNEVPNSASASVKNLFSTAGSIQIRSVAYYVVYQGSVVLSHKAGSAELAGIVSLLLQTIRNYLSLAFVEVFRSSWLPLISGSMHANNHKDINILTDFIERWQGLIASALFLIALFHDLWVPTWLGYEIGKYSDYFAVAIVVYSAEISGAMSNQLIMAAGRSSHLMRFVVISLCIFLVVQFSCSQILGYSIKTVLISVFTFVLMENAVFIPIVAINISDRIPAKNFISSPAKSALFFFFIILSLSNSFFHYSLILIGIVILLFHIRRAIEASRTIHDEMRERQKV